MEKIFTLDIGLGTQDFMLYIENENPRNFPKLVMPSPSKIIAEKILKLARKGKNILLTGYTMGGGANTIAIKQALKKVKIYAFEKAALTISDDLNKVREMGIEIVKSYDNNVEAEIVEMKDVDLYAYEEILKIFNITLPEKIAIAVQDHGFSPNESNRRFRFKLFEKMIKKSPYIHSFLFPASKIPKEFNRMRSVVECVEDFGNENGREFDIYIADTVFSAIAGCMIDVKDFPALLINFGNGHTVGAIIDRDGKIHSLFEHHTSIIKNIDIKKFIDDFIKGKIDNEDVFNQGGHGAYIGDIVDVRDIVVTGPNSRLVEFREANPFGDVMLVGNAGLIEMMKNAMAGV